MLKDFKEFMLRGNVVDMAVGVIVGGAFGKIVSSLVNDILMPPMGRLMGNVDFKDLFITLNDKSYESLDAATRAGAPIIKLGVFFNTVLNFVIVAGAIFFVIKRLTSLVESKIKPADEVVVPTTKECPECAESVLLKARKCKHCGSAV